MDKRRMPAINNTNPTRFPHLGPPFVAFKTRVSEEHGRHVGRKSIQNEQSLMCEGEREFLIPNDSTQQVGTCNLLIVVPVSAASLLGCREIFKCTSAALRDTRFGCWMSNLP